MAITDLEPRLLVEAHNAGDDAAFNHIVRTHHQSLFAHAISRLRDVQAAEDAVQETFVRAYRAMPRFEGDFHLRAWLHRILTNVCHDEGSRRQRDLRLFEAVSAQAVVEGEPADIDIERMDVSREVVAAALASLPTSYRQALVLRYVDELSYEQVAAVTGVTEGNARVRVMRGRDALRRALTSSHAIVIAVVPWLRRGGKGTVVDLPSIGASASASASSVTVAASSVASSHQAVLANAPMFLRALDVAPQVAERTSSIPQIIGMVAAMAVPIAAPVMSDQVADWAVRPAPATAAPAHTEVAAAEPPAGASGTAPTDAATTTTTARSSNAFSATSAAAPVATGETATTSTSTTSTTTPTTTTSTTATTTPATAVVPGTGIDADAAPAPFGASLRGSGITSAGDPTTDLAGPITWDAGGTSVGGRLEGTLVFDRPATASEPEAGEDPPATDASAEPTATPRWFSGELTVVLDDGRTYRIRLENGTLDDVGTGTAASADFELLDSCDTVVASGSLGGELDLQEAPGSSSLDLVFDGQAPAEVPRCE